MPRQVVQLPASNLTHDTIEGYSHVAVLNGTCRYPRHKDGERVNVSPDRFMTALNRRS
jgi:hypothetical protein